MKRHYRMRRGFPAFTIVELLVVIGIIVVLASLLMPALQRARFTAKEVVCVSNIRQMTQAQLAYAADNSGSFPAHRSVGPMYVRDDNNNIFHQSPWWGLNRSYLTNPWVTICPLFAGDDGPGDSANSDPFYTNAIDHITGAWASNAPFTCTNYCFFANWVPFATPTGTTDPKGYITFYDGELPWPRKLREATADRAMMAHGVYFHSNLGGGWDVGHGSRQGSWNATIPTASRQIVTRSSPVGYGDGHVEVHQRDSMKRRASYDAPFYGTTSFWF